MAPVIKELRKHADRIETCVCVTAQHREMLDQVLQAFDITPDIDLDLMRPNQNLAQLTARIFTELDPVLKAQQPDWLLVQGDTTTVMSAAMLGYYNQIQIGHVEAGLRTFDKWQPFPEEVNRRIAGVVADLHFAPTENNRQNLLREGIPDEIIRVTGNTSIDALHMIIKQQTPDTTTQLLTQADVLRETAAWYWSPPTGGKLRSAHRDICKALKQLAHQYRDEITLVYPVHLNPNIQEPVYRELSAVENVILLPPMDYLPLVHLMKHAALIMTDSGGIQGRSTLAGHSHPRPAGTH